MIYLIVVCSSRVALATALWHMHLMHVTCIRHAVTSRRCLVKQPGSCKLRVAPLHQPANKPLVTVNSRTSLVRYLQACTCTCQLT
ncbi:hypothetical protein COO60DRAFT_1517750 [Scenedesmus sp. NREL 46B-D3]|nr:hypothetical protein COO60DRAFT_1517750 [Scenedesmus sp. NREL 46B-D3]